MTTVDEREDFVIDEEELCDYIAKRLRLDSDAVSLVLDAELAFLEGKGLVVEEKPSNQGKSNDVPVGEIDYDELNEYVVSHTGISLETVKSILDTEMHYLEELGVAGNQDG